MHPAYVEEMVGRYERRFWAMVDKRGEDECWPWTGTIGTSGYGMFSSFKGSMRSASREVYELTHGPVPGHLVVCHSCDTPNCCNPKHLWVGTVAENNRDRDAKGRQRGPHGATHPRATTSEETVREIRRLKALGVQQNEIAVKCGVTKVVVSQILTGRTWKHLQ